MGEDWGTMPSGEDRTASESTGRTGGESRPRVRPRAGPGVPGHLLRLGRDGGLAPRRRRVGRAQPRGAPDGARRRHRRRQQRARARGGRAAARPAGRRGPAVPLPLPRLRGVRGRAGRPAAARAAHRDPARGGAPGRRGRGPARAAHGGRAGRAARPRPPQPAVHRPGPGLDRASRGRGAGAAAAASTSGCAPPGSTGCTAWSSWPASWRGTRASPTPRSAATCATWTWASPARATPCAPSCAASWLGRDRRPQDLLVLGDTFGAVADGQGTDSAMLIPELRRAVYVSVGAEPAGAPPQVLHHGGGPIAFLDILHDQLAMREIVAVQSFPQPTTDPAWRFEVKGFDPFREREAETWLTVANGETGTRGALEEGSAISTPATFVAGVYGDGTGDPALPPAGAGARLDRAAPDGRRQRAHPVQRRDPRARARAGPAPRRGVPHVAAAAAQRAHGARAHGALRLAGRPPDHGGARRGGARGLLRVAGVAERDRRDARRRADQGDGVRGHHRPAGARREHARAQRRRARARGDDQPGARLARRAHPAAGARRDRRAPRARRPGHGGPARRHRLGAHQGAVAGGRAPRPRAGARRRLRRAAAAAPRGLGGRLGRRRPARGRRRRRPARPALRHLPHDQHGAPGQGHRLHRRPRPGRHVVLPARVLGHRDLRAAVLHLHAAGDGAHHAQVPLPQPPGRAREGARTWGSRARCTRGSRRTRASRPRRPTATAPTGRRSPSSPA